MKRGSLEYQYDELCTRIALLEHQLDITATSVENYLRMKRELNHLLLKRISLKQRLHRYRTQYKPRVYEPDITVMK